ncbi:hypothetical protein I7I51_02357 [Histoplasma capsulatum]|uniref:Uncharacterized protein n=1 Tax=Ajellomyces capsulatus TaxID=5037 RepID=A0A8A1M7X9_AJECA|nr:hypothetical protein I7I51_02357 [Histoplasma capsulatum]
MPGIGETLKGEQQRMRPLVSQDADRCTAAIVAGVLTEELREAGDDEMAREFCTPAVYSEAKFKSWLLIILGFLISAADRNLAKGCRHCKPQRRGSWLVNPTLSSI